MIYLASASPRRRELLTQIGIEFELLKASVDESVLAGERPHDYVARVAALKAEAGAQNAVTDWPVLAADTIVTIGDEILLKPLDMVDAQRILTRLSGKTHQVKTAISVAFNGVVTTEVITTDVTFRELDEAEIIDYWHSGEPADKAGAYGIQGLAGKFVSSITGSYSSVVGLPLMETERLLKRIKENHHS